MAQIKGFTIKNVTDFKGHEGEHCKQGSLYLDGKKVGYYSDSFMMGPATIDFDSDEAEEKVIQICKEYYAKHSKERWFEDTDPDLEEFMQKLFELVDWEKIFKKRQKQGFNILVCYKEDGYWLTISAGTESDAEKWLEEKRVADYKMFRSLDDFVIQ